MRAWIMMVWLAWAPTAGAGEFQLTGTQATDIAALWEDIGPYDDIRHEGYVGHTRVVDLNGDGMQEIVYLASSYCEGASFDCPNTLTVLAGLVAGKGRISANRDEYEARARRTGYVPDAGAQIPGEVMGLSVKKNRIDVDFIVRADSPICRQQQRDRDGRKLCPEPGRYHWAYAWSPGRLERLPDTKYDAVAPRAHFPTQLQDRWVVAGTSCEQAREEGGKRYVQFGWDRMTGLGEEVWPNTVVLLAQRPWSWRIVTERRGDKGRQVPSLFILTEQEDRLILVEEQRVRTFDRCRF